MTPKEKAIDLYSQFNEFVGLNNFEAKECALIAVDEILNESPSKIYWQTYDDETPSAYIYWQEVKKEIENL